MKKNISKNKEDAEAESSRKQRAQAVKQRAQARKQRAQARKKGETPQAGGKQRESWGKQRVTIGLDLGDRKSKYCVFDGVNYLKEADVPTTPEEMKAVFGARKP